MLERLKRRVAGEKVEMPRVLQRLRTMVTPRSARAAAAAAEGDASLPSTPGSRRGSARRPITAAAVPAAAPAAVVVPMPPGQQGAAVGAEGEPAVEAAEGEVVPQRWGHKVQQAAEQLTAHPDFQLAVMLVIVLNCAGECKGHACSQCCRHLHGLFCVPQCRVHGSFAWRHWHQSHPAPCTARRLQRWRCTGPRCRWTAAGMPG